MTGKGDVPGAVLALVAGELADLHPTAYEPAHHPIDPTARRDAERLLAALADQGVTVTIPTRRPVDAPPMRARGRTALRPLVLGVTPVSAVPIRYRRVVETHAEAEYTLLLPASLLAVSELLDTARAALRDDARPISEATVYPREGELVVSFPIEPDADPAPSAAQVVNLR